jgi:hypothetical protein
MTDDISAAMAECAVARAAAARPLAFSAEAEAETRRRSEAQFRANFPLIPGGWTTCRPAVLKASLMLGDVARAITVAIRPEATEITLDYTKIARLIVERECKFKVARAAGKDPNDVSVADGLVCGEG